MKKVNNNLTEEELIVLRDKGTERAFSGKFDSFFEDGTYKCKNCGQELFKSETKYNAGCGWPSFFECMGPNAVCVRQDTDGLRHELICHTCHSHLGHVFFNEIRVQSKQTRLDKRGVSNSNERHCVNSVALVFKPQHSEHSSSHDDLHVPLDLQLVPCTYDGLVRNIPFWKWQELLQHGGRSK